MSESQIYHNLQEAMTWVATKYGEQITEKRAVASLSSLGLSLDEACGFVFESPEEKVDYAAWLTRNTPRFVFREIVQKAMDAGYTYVDADDKKRYRSFFTHTAQRSAYKRKRGIARVMLQKTPQSFSFDFLLNGKNVFLDWKKIAKATQLSRKEIVNLVCELSNLSFEI